MRRGSKIHRAAMNLAAPAHLPGCETECDDHAVSDEDAFERLTAPYRRELHVHCYRMLGSVQDAEDMLQETLMAAWRGLDRFEERSSLRTWLYRIATNACLGMLRRGRTQRELPPPPEPPGAYPAASGATVEPVWLEPYPDVWLDDLPDAAPGPEARYDAKESIELAFVTALQQLSARERAAVVLKDVLGFRAAETAELLDTSPAAVNSALQRGREKLDRAARNRPSEAVPMPGSDEERDLVGRFASAFEAGDVDSVVALLSSDARLTMPPEPMAYVGPAEIRRFFSTVPALGALERFKLVPTRANGQPAFGCYLRMPQGPLRAYGFMVLTLAGGRVTAITGFPDTSVFASFGLPRTLPD
jgi:RNA polymerase sigma-70 factor (TIGR02960 family)